jgi:hypothetical protein
MLTVGEYSIPEKITFKEALDMAKLAVERYDGKMSNKAVAEALGYKIKDPKAISGYIFRKFDDMCAYNLLKRERGYLETTSLAEEALDPYDSRKAEEGKAEAIRQMPIVNKAFTQWNGKIPPETAFPSKLKDLLGLSWQDAQKHGKTVRKLLIEVFPYLESAPKSEEHKDISVSDKGVGRDTVTIEKTFASIGANELRTEEYGVLKIRDETSIDIGIQILQSLKRKLSQSKGEKKEEKLGKIKEALEEKTKAN